MKKIDSLETKSKIILIRDLQRGFTDFKNGYQSRNNIVKDEKCDLVTESHSTWCVQVLRSPKEAFAAAMQSWRERCEK